MKKDTHPAYPEVNVTCSCGEKFKTQSTIDTQYAIVIFGLVLVFDGESKPANFIIDVSIP